MILIKAVLDGLKGLFKPYLPEVYFLPLPLLPTHAIPV